ncbi:carboxypeptidase regulatory-like domain-containing protein [Terriglobus albidus]|uniref:Carboxypeptidase regulatory-like domain-containing protein n=1 Tax=Terriglobus albidus TaxID=1592106 RepID=A0A5B9EFF0_9BACT|nr:carboxypeptidase-like regulatory domain-containing protein [Terriglobus albidus]QEE30802.1 carboxypeptidase regulatory-like domain-containing protein [Terriglobus albidus]
MIRYSKPTASAGSGTNAVLRRPFLSSRGITSAARRSLLGVMLAAAPLFVLNIASPAAFGQASSSSDAAGKVTDATGAAVPGATIHLVNNGTGAERIATSNNEGDWSIPNVPPSNYKIRVEKQGFKAAQIPSLDIEIGKTANGSVTLSVGEVTDTVEVSTLPPQLQTQEATVGQVIDQKQITDLPLNGRNVLQLATLAPGVSPPQSGQTGTPAQTGTQTTSRQLYISVDGGRASSTNYVLDGTYVRSVRFNNMSLQPNADTIQEFNLLRSTFSTEYGQGQAVVSMVTKSGTNTIHGSGYEFARNAIFDARNYFTTVAANPVKPNFTRHQYGGTVGFPVIKDKLFLFGGFEGLKLTRDNPTFALFPTQAELAGNAANADPSVAGNTAVKPATPCVQNSTNSNNCVGINMPANWNPAALGSNQASSVLAATYPVLTSDSYVSGYGTNNYALTRSFTESYNQYTIRGDWVVSTKNSLFGRYVNFDSSQQTPAASGSFTSNPLLGRNAVLGNTYLISSNIVNEVRVGWNEFYNITLGVLQDSSKNWAAVSGLKNVTALNSTRQNGRAGFTINGYGNVGDGSGDQGGHENIISIGDSLSIVHGKHTFKTGFQYQNRRLWQIADNNSRGAATFDNCTKTNCIYNGVDYSTYTDPATGNPVLYNKFQNYARGFCTSSCNGNAGTTMGHYRDNTYGAFFNDTWQFGHGLTFTLGFRWEYNSPFVEQNGLEGTLDPSTQKVTFSKVPSGIPAFYLASGSYEVNKTFRPGIIEPNYKGFMPRVGLAWEARSGTVLRAGYGIYLDNLNTNELQFTRYAAPLYYQQAFSAYPVAQLWPDPVAAVGVTQVPSPFSILPKNSRPYTEEYNLSLQQDLGKGLVMELAYTGSQTHKSWKRYDQNMCVQYPFVAPSWALTGQCVNSLRPYPAFGQGILTSSTRGDANFHGGSIKIEKRARNGLFYLGSYQFSKNLDNFSGEAAANDSSFATDMGFDRSYSNFDNRNKAVISGGYELPFGKGKKWAQSGVANAIAGGWSLQPAVQLRGGYAFNVSRSGCNFAAYNGCRVFLAAGKKVSDAYRSSPSPFNWFDPSAFTTRYDGVASTASTANPGIQGWVTRNALRGPGTANVDLSGIKNFVIHERFRAQFRAEAYNILNRAIFSNPAANITAPTAVGKVTSTSLDNRSIQLAVKVTW